MSRHMAGPLDGPDGRARRDARVRRTSDYRGKVRSVGLRPERVAGRRDLPAVPRGPEQRRPRLVGLLRRLPRPRCPRTARAGRQPRPRERSPRPPRRPRCPPRRRAAHLASGGRAPSAAAEPPSARRAQPARRRRPPPPAATPRAAPAPAPRHAAQPPPGEHVPLRGAGRPGRGQHGGLASTVPTATSVRAVPAKLLIDNRIVINNHLARARGGKVSLHPPHRLRARPGAGRDAGDERRASPRSTASRPWSAPGARQPRPGDRPGQAGRHPPAARAEHQGRRDDGLRRVLGRLRGHRPQGPRRQARPSTTSPAPRITPDQPRHHRHHPLGAPPDAGPGRDHRRRRDGVPGRVPGRRPRRRSPAAGGQQDHDADLDLRPPDHPGRAVRRVPAARPPAAARRATASTTRSSARCASRTSRSAGSRDIADHATTTTSTRPPGSRS